MKLLNHEIEGVIFDIDGTLLESTMIWDKVDENFFKKRGMEVPDGYAQAIGHIGLTNAAIYTKTTYHITESIEEIIAEWKNGVVEYYKNKVLEKPNATKFIKLLKEHKIPFCAATANDEDCYKNGLLRIGVYELFDFVLEVNNYKSKNDPEIYFEASKKLGVSVNKCLVLEDLLMGLETAHRAGFLTVAVSDVKNEKDKEELIKTSNLYIKDYQELIEKIEF